MNTINVEEIYQTLLELLKAYDLDGYVTLNQEADMCFFLSKRDGKWNIYYYERGYPDLRATCPTFLAACIELIKMLTPDDWTMISMIGDFRSMLMDKGLILNN